MKFKKITAVFLSMVVFLFMMPFSAFAATVSNDVTVGEDSILNITSNTVISSSGKITIQSGAVFTVNEGYTLTIEDGGSLVMEEGSIININGAIINNGNITNNGTITFGSDGSLSLGGELVFSNMNGVSYSDGVYTVSMSGDYTVSMADGVSSTSDSIKVNDSLGNVELTLDNIYITESLSACAIDLGTSSTVIFLKGDNTIATNRKTAIRVAHGGAVRFYGSGSLSILTGSGTGIGGLRPLIYSQHGENAGSVYVYSGKITINSNDGVCIGGGNSGGDSDGGNGGNGGNVEIHGGKVNLTSTNGVCIGGGSTDGAGSSAGNGGLLIIRGGIVNAQSTNNYAVGHGTSSSVHYYEDTNVTIEGSKVYFASSNKTAFSSNSPVLVGGDEKMTVFAGESNSALSEIPESPVPSETLTDITTSVYTAKYFKTYPQSTFGGELYFDNISGVSYSGGVYTVSKNGNYTVSMAYGKITTTDSIKVNDSLTGVNLTLNGVSIKTDGGSVLDTGTSNVNVTLTGENNLITQNINAAAVRVPENGTLTIKGDGKLYAQTDKVFSMGAAIGGNGTDTGNAENCGTVNITESANVVAENLAEPSYGAGIGGGATFDGSGSSGGTVNINGNATVSATGFYGAGIGGGYNAMNGGNGGTVNISGNANVTAKSTNGSAAIGGGCGGTTIENTNGSGATVTISDNAVVDASADNVGIGGWDGGTVTVNGGTVKATGVYGAGIGGGQALASNKSAGNGGTLTVNGGTVIAKSRDGAGIGGGATFDGSGSSGGIVNISGGTIIASSTSAPAIGGGGNNFVYGASAEVNINSGYIYEWAHNEDAVYKVGSFISFDNNNASKYVCIRPCGTYGLFRGTVSSVDFGTRGVGYRNTPEAGTFTISNVGNREIEISVSSSENYNLSLSTTRIPVGGEATLTVIPKINLGIGTYNERINITGSNNVFTYVDASFEVNYIDTPVNPITISPEPNANGWNNTDVTITPAAGYKINYTNFDSNKNFLTVNSSQEATSVYLINANGERTDAISLRAIKIDKTNPSTVTVSYENNGWHQFLNTVTFGLFFKETVSVKLTATDADSGIKEFKYSLDGGATFTTVTAVGNEATFNIEPQFKGKIVSYAVDNVGLTSSATSTEGFAVDSILPTASITPVTAGQNSKVIANEGGKDVYAFAADLMLNVNAADNGSGIKSVDCIVYKIDKDGNSAIYDEYNLYNYVAPANATASDLVHLLDENTLSFIVPKEIDSRAKAVISVTDNSGNTYETSCLFGIDNTAPEVILSADISTIKTEDTLGITAHAGVSGIEKVEYSIDGGSYIDITSTYTNGITVNANGTYTVKVTNGVGVSSTAEKTYTNIDNQKPVVKVNSGSYVSGTWTNENVVISLGNETANLGDTVFEYKVNDQQWRPYTGLIVINTDTNGTATLVFRAKSAAGVYSDDVIFEVMRDTAEPIITGVTDGESYYFSKRILADDLYLKAFSINGEMASNPDVLEGNKDVTYTLVATDYAGNIKTISVQMKSIASIIETIKDINKDNVKSSDKDELLKVKTDLQNLLNLNDADMTDDNEAEITNDIAVIDGALKALENAQAVNDIIEALPDADKVTESDNTAIYAAKAAFDKLTDHEKTLVDATKLNACLNVLDSLIKIPKTGEISGTEIVMLMFITSGTLSLAYIYINKKRREDIAE